MKSTIYVENLFYSLNVISFNDKFMKVIITKNKLGLFH